MSTPYLDYAKTTAQIMTDTWFGPTAPTNWVETKNDYWRAPTLINALVDLMKLTGEQNYLSTLENGKDAFYVYFDPNTSPCERYLPSYYDDETVWGACFMDAYALTSDDAYLTASKQIYNDLRLSGWGSLCGGNDPCSGGMWWRRSPKSFNGNTKASNSTLGYIQIALDLYAVDHTTTSYLTEAQKAWKWIDTCNLIADTGLVWGGVTETCAVDPNNAPVIALQGNPLAGLWGLYETSGDTSYLDLAELIIHAATTKMVWPDDQILRVKCETDNSCTPNDTNSALFKGIFVRFLGDFVQRLATVDDPARKKAAAQYAAFLQHNADTLWANYPKHIFGIDWHVSNPDYQPTGHEIYDASLQNSALALFIATAQVANLLPDSP